MFLRTLVGLALLGAAVGAALDFGGAALLPAAPWPPPFGAGWGAAIGGGAGLVAGAGLGAAAFSGQLPRVAPAALWRTAGAALAFALIVSVMVGGLGYASGHRAAAERDLVLLREARRDLDKKQVDPQMGAARIARLEASSAARRDSGRAARDARQAAGIAALAAALMGVLFGSLALQSRRLRDAAESPLGTEGV